MSEMQIQNLPGLQWWLKRRSAYFLRNGVMILCILGIFAALFGAGGWKPEDLQGALLAGIVFGIFLLFGIWQLVRWARSRNTKVSRWWYGTIVGTHCIHSAKKKVRSYHVIADVNGKEMDSVCLLKTYNRAEPGQRVLLFTLEGDKVFCVHPDQN